MAQDLKIEQELVQIQHLRMEELNVLEMHQNHKLATLTLALLVMIIQNINDRENNSRKFKFLNIIQLANLSSYFWLASDRLFLEYGITFLTKTLSKSYVKY